MISHLGWLCVTTLLLTSRPAQNSKKSFSPSAERIPNLRHGDSVPFTRSLVRHVDKLLENGHLEAIG